MKNLKRFGVLLLVLTIGCLVVDIVYLLYAYTTCSKAIKDTLTNIALVVAEENCVSTDAADSTYVQIKKLLVENAPIWLVYNDDGTRTTKEHDDWVSAKPTNIVHQSLEDAMSNVEWSIEDVDEKTYSAIKLTTSADETNEEVLYSYVTCPQRGTPITIHLSGYIHLKAYTMVGTFRYSIPIHEQITVVGMKFYKGKDSY